MLKTWMKSIISVALLSAAIQSSAKAQSPADFYKGKTIDLFVGYSAGGGYDTYARTIARHMGKHIPGNPTIAVKNMPGASSRVLANHLYNAAPKDGTAFGTIERGAPFDPLFGVKEAEFDAAKFTWLGSANNEVSLCVAWHTSGIKSIEELQTTELVVGGTGPSSGPDQYPRIINGVLGTKFKVVTGYPGSNEVSLAMERGEVQGRCGWSWTSISTTQKTWYDEKKIIVLVQLSGAKHPDLQNVPLILDLAKTPEQKQILNLVFSRQALGRPYVAPPGVPADRAGALRKGFMDTMKDKEFLADAEKQKLEISSLSGEDVQKIIEEAYKTDKVTVQKTAEMLKAPR